MSPDNNEIAGQTTTVFYNNNDTINTKSSDL